MNMDVRTLFRDDVLSDEQRVVFDAALQFAEDPSSGDTLFAGGQAGAGKTHLLSHLARHFPEATLLALIGKAAANLATRTGRRAQTMHSFLYELEQVTKNAAGRAEMMWRNKHGAGDFAKKLVLLDEAPIAGERVVRDLLNTGCRIIAVGDPNQLRPVNQAPYFVAPDYLLTEPHRQALDSPVIRQAHRILRGHHYEADGNQFRVMARAYDADILGADITLCWTHKQRVGLNARARALRGITSPTPVPGEPLVCRKNYRRAEVYKGAIYELLEPFGPGDTTITISVDGEPRSIKQVKFAGIENDVDEDEAISLFDYGHAITVHSSAGSEWSNVLVFDNYPRADADYGRFIYTAVTRASSRITVVRGR